MKPDDWIDDADEPEGVGEEYEPPFWCEYCQAAIYSEDQYTHAHRHMDKGPTVDAVAQGFESL